MPGVKFVDNTCALQRAYCLIRLPNAIMDTSFDQNIESILPLRNDAVKIRFSSDRDGNHSPQYVQRILDEIFKKTYQGDLGRRKNILQGFHFNLIQAKSAAMPG